MNDKKNIISIIIVVHDQGYLLEQNLRQFISVAQETEAELIVVDDASTDDTSDILKQMKEECPLLYSTFLPHSLVMNHNHQKLAYAIGIKAAHGDYIVLADIGRPPLSVEWLEGLANPEAEVALVYTSRKADSMIHQSMTSLEEARPYLLHAERKTGNGHKGRWFKFRRGIYDAVSVRKERAFDAIQYFDQHIPANQLMALRMSIFMKNLF